MFLKTINLLGANLDTFYAHCTHHLNTSQVQTLEWSVVVDETLLNLVYYLMEQGQFKQAERLSRLYKSLPKTDAVLAMLYVLLSLSDTLSLEGHDLEPEACQERYSESASHFTVMIPKSVSTKSPSADWTRHVQWSIPRSGLSSFHLEGPLPKSLSETDSGYESLESLVETHAQSDLWSHPDVIQSPLDQKLLAWDDAKSGYLSEANGNVFHAVYCDVFAIDPATVHLYSQPIVVESCLKVMMGVASSVFEYHLDTSTFGISSRLTAIKSLSVAALEEVLNDCSSCGSHFRQLSKLSFQWKTEAMLYKCTGAALGEGLADYLYHLQGILGDLIASHQSQPLTLLECVSSTVNIQMTLLQLSLVFGVDQSLGKDDPVSTLSPIKVLQRLYNELTRLDERVRSESNQDTLLHCLYLSLLRLGSAPLFNFLDQSLGLSTDSQDPFGEFQRNGKVSMPFGSSDMDELLLCVSTQRTLAMKLNDAGEFFSLVGKQSMKSQVSFSSLDSITSETQFKAYFDERVEMIRVWRSSVMERVVRKRHREKNDSMARVARLQDVWNQVQLDQVKQDQILVEKRQALKDSIADFLQSREDGMRLAQELQLEKDSEQANRDAKVHEFLKKLEILEGEAMQHVYETKVASLDKLDQRLKWRQSRFELFMKRKECLSLPWDEIPPVTVNSILVGSDLEEDPIEETFVQGLESQEQTSDDSEYQSAVEDVSFPEMIPESPLQFPAIVVEHAPEKIDLAIDLDLNDVETDVMDDIEELAPIINIPSDETELVETKVVEPITNQIVATFDFEFKRIEPNQSNVMTEFEKILSSMQDVSYVPWTLWSTSSLKSAWKSQSKLLDCVILGALFSDGSELLSNQDIRFHFNLLSQRFCISDGVFSHALVDSLFRENEYADFQTSLDLNGRSVWPPTLEEALSCLIRVPLHSSTDVYLEWEIHSLVQKQVGRDASDLDALNRLDLTYSVPKQLSFVFTPSILKSYQQVFGWMLKLLRVDECLNRINLARVWSNHSISESKWTRTEFRTIVQFVQYARVLVKGLVSFCYDLGISHPLNQFQAELRMFAECLDPGHVSWGSFDRVSVAGLIEQHSRFASRMRVVLLLDSHLHSRVRGLLQSCIHLSFVVQGIPLEQEVPLSDRFKSFQTDYSALVKELHLHVLETRESVFDDLLIRIDPLNNL